MPKPNRSSSESRPFGRRPALAAALLVLLQTAACGRADRVASPDESVQGIVLVMIDTLRADHVSAYGYYRDTTPTLERLAREGVLFEKVQAPSPWTIPTIASLWTGVYPSRHGAGIIAKPGEVRRFPAENPHFQGFSRAAPTLPGCLRDLGYRTYAWIANPLLRQDCYLDDFDEVRIEYANAESVVDWVLDRLETIAEGKFFLYVHFFDIHQPITPPDEFLTRYLPELSVEFASGAELEQFKEGVSRWSWFGTPQQIATPEFAAFKPLKIAAYDGAVRYVDHQLGRLVEALRDEGLFDRTAIAVTSDHGEELWDHWELERDCYDGPAIGRIGIDHGHTLFQELLHVPLIVCGPGVGRGSRVGSRLSLLDLGATLVDLARPVTAAPVPLGDGVSFVEALKDQEVASRLTIAEGVAYGYELFSIMDSEGRKYVWAPYSGEKDLMFRVDEDPRELSDLTRAEPEMAKELRERLELFIEQQREHPLPAGETATDMPEELRQLGYPTRDR
ncbi:MAG: sulfatase [Planctomycetota bacterium]